jgi:predicted XRE-type DNA-binding protein
MATKVKVHEGSGNVFADLGLPQPKDRQAKALIAIHIERLIDEAGWTQAEAAQRMGVSQPDVSNIVKGRLVGFSLDRLFQCLDALDQRIEINITPSASCASQEKTVLSW